jgi:hypothetical protein
MLTPPSPGLKGKGGRGGREGWIGDYSGVFIDFGYASARLHAIILPTMANFISAWEEMMNKKGNRFHPNMLLCCGPRHVPKKCFSCTFCSTAGCLLPFCTL